MNFYLVAYLQFICLKNEWITNNSAISLENHQSCLCSKEALL